MPELPEVETTLRGILPHTLNQKITSIIVRQPKLRWPIPDNLDDLIKNQSVTDIKRRGKYLLLTLTHGTLILHLGMSGRLRVLTTPKPAERHDHVDFYFSNGSILRYTDPRRFGAILWTEDPAHHPLLKDLGPEPLTPAFNGEYLKLRASKKTVPVKTFIMDHHVVVGVGNIYAAEALFQAGIHPLKPAGKVSLPQYHALAHAIKAVLQFAIKKGGTTLKDFMKSDGSPGYFSIELQVYGREGQPCINCSTPLSHQRIGQRSTVFCRKCQK